MDRRRSLAHAVLVAAADAALVSMALATGLTAIDAHEGRWLAHGLGQLVPLGWAGRVQELLPLALFFAGVLLVLELLLRGVLRRRGTVAAGVLLFVAAVGGLLALALRGRLVPWLLAAWPAAGHFVAVERLHWTLVGRGVGGLVGAGLVVLAAGRVLGDLRSRRVPARPSWRHPVLVAIALAALLGGAAWDRAVLQRAPGDNVVLIVLDTVSALHLASHGYPRDTMPELEAWASRGRSYPQARSVAPWTLPSHASLFTGLMPIQHGATQEHAWLAQRFDTLAERLRARGYLTFAAVGNPVVGHPTQLDQGFGRFLPTWRRDVKDAWGKGRRHVDEQALLHFLDSLRKGEHFFAFLNYMDAHAPYDPPRSFDARVGVPPGARKVNQDWPEYYEGLNPLGPAQFAALRALYDGGLAALSQNVDSLLRALQSRGLLRNTLVIVTADHGENVGDHGLLGHVFSLNETLLRVPLFLLGAGVEEPASDPRVATSLDVTDTVLAAAGLSDPRIHGFDLRRAGPAPRRPSVSEYYFPKQVLSDMPEESRRRMLPHIHRYLRRMRAIDEDGWKLIWGSDGHDALYDLKDDPGEKVNLAERDPARVEALQEALQAQLRQIVGPRFSLGREPPPSRTTAGFQGLDSATRKQLRALGYVQ